LKYFNAYDFISRGQMLEARSEIDKGRQKLKDSTAAMKDIIKQLQDSHLCIVPMPRGVPVFKNMLASIKGMKNKYSELAGMTEHLEGKSLLLNKNKLNELKTRTYWAEKKGDMSWTKSPVYSDFIVYLSKPPILALDQTSVQIMYDSKNLYFKIVMNDKANKKPFTKNQNNSGANFWKKGLEENTAEIFICPPSLKNGFFQFACNPLGVKFSVININGKAKPNNCEWTVKTKQENGFWSAFITIPFCIFNSPPPQTGDSWKMGVARQQVKNNGNVTFSMLSPMMEDGLYPKLNFR
jgi:hypothetical protein